MPLSVTRACPLRSHVSVVRDIFHEVRVTGVDVEVAGLPEPQR